MDVFWKTETYEWAFKTAGFREFHMRKPLMSPKATSEEKEFYSDLIEKQLLIFVEAKK